MTAQTQSQRNASYRQRQRDKIARYEGALRWSRNNASDPEMIRIIEEALK